MRRAFLNACLTVLSAAFLLVLLEVSLRLYDRYLDFRFPEAKQGSALFERDPLLGWRNKANFETYYSKKKDRFRVFVKTNSQHLRDEEYPHQKPAGTKRILLLGDSVAEGLEVARENVIDVKLEAFLARHGAYEVINAGVQAYGTDQQLLYLKEKGLLYAPDIIIHIAVFNDPTENITIHQRQRPFGKAYFRLDESGTLGLQGIPIPEFNFFDPWVLSLKEAERYYNQAGEPGPPAGNSAAVSSISSVKGGLAKLYIYQWISERLKQNEKTKNLLIRWKLIEPQEEDKPKPEPVKAYEYLMHSKLLEAMRDTARSANAKFLVYEFSTGIGRKPALPTDVQKMCGELGVSYLNSFEDFFGNSGGAPVYAYRYDGHWNARGHALAAQSIYRFLIEQGWVG